MDIKLFAIIAICLSVAACGGGGGSSSSPAPPNVVPAIPTPAPVSGNFVHIQITPGSGAVCSYANASCVTVSVCEVGNPGVCDSVDNILLDTGSFGLRVFGSLLPHVAPSLVPMKSGGLPVAECVGYADGTSNWGPVMYANITLGSGFTVESIPIQVLDAAFANNNANSYCPGAVATPAAFMLNGIIGVGPFSTDKGVSTYFACNDSFCSEVPNNIPPAYVTNPVSKFGPGNNNGLTITFGDVASTGVFGADGYAIFGVGSNSSNTPSPETSYNIFQIQNGDPIPMNVYSTLNETQYSSFLDTGSNFFYFIDAILPTCSNRGLCPSNNTAEVAIMSGPDGSGNISNSIINFNIGNANGLLATGNTAFSNVGFTNDNIGGIDWGLPFYLGRTVYTVFAHESADINGTPIPPSNNGYWVY